MVRSVLGGAVLGGAVLGGEEVGVMLVVDDDVGC